MPPWAPFLHPPSWAGAGGQRPSRSAGRDGWGSLGNHDPPEVAAHHGPDWEMGFGRTVFPFAFLSRWGSAPVPPALGPHGCHARFSIPHLGPQEEGASFGVSRGSEAWSLDRPGVVLHPRPADVAPEICPGSGWADCGPCQGVHLPLPPPPPLEDPCDGEASHVRLSSSPAASLGPSSGHPCSSSLPRHSPKSPGQDPPEPAGGPSKAPSFGGAAPQRSRAEGLWAPVPRESRTSGLGNNEVARQTREMLVTWVNGRYLSHYTAKWGGGARGRKLGGAGKACR